MPNKLWWTHYVQPILAMLASVAALVGLTALGNFGLLAAFTALTNAKGVPWWWGFVVAGLALGVYLALVRFVERRPVDEFDLHEGGRELALGAALGALAFSAVLGLLVAGGIYRVQAGTGPATLGFALAAAVLSGVSEEILVRGIIFRRLAVPLGSYGALLFSSIFFGAGHLANPGATLGGALAIALEAGVLLGAAYIVTRRLWIPIGLHFAWNFTQGGLFGVKVSGTDFGGSLLHSIPVAGHDAISGGAFGVEASPIAVAVCLLIAVPMLMIAHRRRLIAPPAWLQKQPEQTQDSLTEEI